MTVAAVVLAAGGSTRLREPKQLLVDERGEMLVHRTAREALEVGLYPVVVVIGAFADEVRAAVHNLDVIIEQNDGWSRGLSSSIRAGVAAAMESRPEAPGDWKDIGVLSDDDPHVQMLHVQTTRVSYGGITGALLLTCDMPSVGKTHLQALLDARRNYHHFVASAYGDTIGIPAIIPAIEFLNLQKLEGDKGAKGLFAREGTALVPLIGGSFDLDTPSDVTRWREGFQK